MCLTNPHAIGQPSNCLFQTEMRGARLQHHDLDRTGKFLTTMLSKDDVKDLEKPEIPEPPRQQSLVNGNALPFRADPKARFSEPPAPPPQQPLPEKPDIPALKRAVTDRPKPHPNTSPIRDNVSQIMQLQEDLKNTKRELEGRDARLRELEESLQKERTARESAEELARRLEGSAAHGEQPSDDSAHDASASVQMNGTVKGVDLDDILDDTFAPPRELAVSEDAETVTSAFGQSLADQAEGIQTAAAEYQSRVDAMASEIKGLKDQLDLWRQRCETAEAERDADRQTLAEKVAQIRRDEQERQAVAAAAASKRSKSRGRSKSRRQSASRKAGKRGAAQTLPEEPLPAKASSEPDGAPPDDSGDKTTLSRASTITPQAPHAGALPQDPRLAASLPYASMIGVVLLGVGLMAYINGWQPAPKR